MTNLEMVFMLKDKTTETINKLQKNLETFQKKAQGKKLLEVKPEAEKYANTSSKILSEYHDEVEKCKEQIKESDITVLSTVTTFMANVRAFDKFCDTQVTRILLGSMV